METLRLRLRRFQTDDLENMIRLESDPEVMKFAPLRLPLSKERIQERLEQTVAQESSRAPFGVWAVDRKDGAFVGWLMLLKTDLQWPELGFMFVRSQWGQGYAKEAAARLLQHGFEDLHLPAVMARTDHDHQVSQKVLSSLGFEFSQSVQKHDPVWNREILLDHFLVTRERFDLSRQRVL